MAALISIVIPVYNEEGNLPHLYNELKGVLSKSKDPYEIIFVDDGSTDKSEAMIRQTAKSDSNVKGIIFRRNYGQTSAIAAGIDYSKGSYIMTMDADLQNDPQDIISLMQKIRDGYDLVSGWRRKRKEPFIKRRLPSLIANYIISASTGLKLHDYGCTLKAYRKDFLKNINLYGEMHRFMPLYVYWQGGKIAEVEVHHRERKWGNSKYGMNRMLKVIFDLITVKFLLGNYSTSPLYFFGGWGILLMVLGTLCGMFTLFQKFMWGFWVHRNPLLLLAVFLFILGTQIIFIGLLAELNIRIYYETTKKSVYTVKEEINC